MPMTTREALDNIESLPYEVVVDRQGVPVRIGDRVRVPMFPRGTIEGTVVSHPRRVVVERDGSFSRALAIDVGEGAIYGITPVVTRVRQRRT